MLVYKQGYYISNKEVKINEIDFTYHSTNLATKLKLLGSGVPCKNDRLNYLYLGLKVWLFNLVNFATPIE